MFTIKFKYIVGPITIDANYTTMNVSVATEKEAYEIFYKILFETDNLFYLTIIDDTNGINLMGTGIMGFDSIGDLRSISEKILALEDM